MTERQEEVPVTPYWSQDWQPRSGEAEVLSATQVAVVGGGYTGLSAALRLAQAGTQVVVLEQGAQGDGASGRNGGMVLSGLPVGMDTLVRRFGPELAARMFASTLEAIDCVFRLVREGEIGCDLKRAEHVAAAVRPGHMRDLTRERDLVATVSGHTMPLLQADQVRDKLGTDRYWGGLVDPWAGALHPAKFQDGLACMAEKAGARLCWQTRVEDIQSRAGKFRLRTQQKEVIADRVILATNGYSQGLVPWMQRRVVPVESMVLATREIPEQVMQTILPGQCTVSDTKRILHYFRRSPDGKRIIFGGRPPLMRGGIQAKARALYRDMVSIFPQLRPYPPACVWAGNVGFTRDHLPHTGQHNGMMYAAGYCGHGVALATYYGQKLAAWILGQEQAQELSAASDFPPFPLYGNRAWFVPPALAWYALLDRFS